MDRRIRVLFICVHNCARSQMAEVFLNDMAPDRFVAESAGLDPEPVMPLVIEAMRELGYDLSAKEPRSVFDLVDGGEKYDFVVAVCEPEAEEGCPTFPDSQRLQWPLPTPSKLTGTDEEKLAAIRDIRDAIRRKVEALVAAEG